MKTAFMRVSLEGLHAALHLPQGVRITSAEMDEGYGATLVLRLEGDDLPVEDNEGAGIVPFVTATYRIEARPGVQRNYTCLLVPDFARTPSADILWPVQVAQAPTRE